MGGGDQRDDCEAKSRAARASPVVGPAEPVEGSIREAGREARALVGHVQLDARGARDDRQPDVSVAVGEGVVDEVPDRLLEACGIGVDRGVVTVEHRQRAPQLHRAGRKPLGHVREQLLGESRSGRTGSEP